MTEGLDGVYQIFFIDWQFLAAKMMFKWNKDLLL